MAPAIPIPKYLEARRATAGSAYQHSRQAHALLCPSREPIVSHSRRLRFDKLLVSSEGPAGSAWPHPCHANETFSCPTLARFPLHLTVETPQPPIDDNLLDWRSSTCQSCGPFLLMFVPSLQSPATISPDFFHPPTGISAVLSVMQPILDHALT